jgi:peptidoglycan/LPS O-acetylase OafA/YrhL
VVAAPGDVPHRFELFDLLRICAGLAVLLSHSFALTGHAEPVLVTAGKQRLTLGAAGVAVFFLISGFLVAASWMRSPVAGGYVRRRFARIWPGFAVCLILTTLVAGPLLTSLSAGDFLGARETRDYLGHGLLMAPVEHYLPGVFEGNPYPGAVNGSLWTLPYEMLAYGALLLLGLAGAFRWKGLLVAAACGVFAVFQAGVGGSTLDLGGHMLGLDVYFLVWFGTWFLAGALIYAFGLWRSWPIFVLALAGAPLGVAAGSPLLVDLALAFIVIAVGTQRLALAAAVRKLGDPSYGLYIYGFLIQQILVGAGAGASPWVLFAEASAFALGAGYLSWHLVEEPALRLLRRSRVAVDEVAAESAPESESEPALAMT